MVQVDFSEEERMRRDTVSGSGTVGGISGWLIQMGFAGDEKQANQVLTIVLIGVLVITAIIAWRALGSF
ncbi:MAG: hypothetical protein A3C08_01145 [Candidatus Taylorbacteria bacterium RIFCSPHIGHO2_02_FULL_47_18]|uniref:Uncharacterized protein n=1 Tax=Candidatus Taylorbacteria bacterium RIFCSPLOWO2_01_FULL_48_100 TaxID=1802322 RepID=A0A1G2NG54_9BACT|nr:MAG: hypothetical protein A2670_00285 [Candidatus Taylorbacteria bacterium RIFCSPHIGHO2_01_FULL_48_38]OHA28291.1 MAG: hypothetical protein A3C08_01145 [Candidatus Taylorbacteria bacterium RIFCSPHIGHO2_02_FULL_47_18]OHA35055.1 MAG: hypothetical protein A2938_00600 [Candidatus Taylorbacteria bacterium RIFCSPLOWO2_01_FULL_48_100]OHA40618.1 MAG: hypothetical protein A3J31_02330 [Candidatus Taylorbacteria bacterium RIFCSPLOWO2_02_FULL_48_16]OHA44848.1 MAG: hypothetical protein A3H13_00655 [Candid